MKSSEQQLCTIFQFLFYPTPSHITPTFIMRLLFNCFVFIQSHLSDIIARHNITQCHNYNRSRCEIKTIARLVLVYLRKTVKVRAAKSSRGSRPVEGGWGHVPSQNGGFSRARGVKKIER